VATREDANSFDGEIRRALAPPDKATKRRFEVLHHPWRVRILEVLNDRDMSCAQCVDEGLIPDLDKFDRSTAISKLAYHFRELREAGALEVVEEKSSGGSTEHICRGAARAHITTEEWSDLPKETRRAISRTMAQGLMARTEGAFLHDTFDERIDRHIAWIGMELDERGWSDMAGLLDGVLEAALLINRESQERLDSGDGKPIRTTWGQLHFQSPPLPGS
jgi:DNA-binding transcriptional ArsR family regulator